MSENRFIAPSSLTGRLAARPAAITRFRSPFPVRFPVAPSTRSRTTSISRSTSWLVAPLVGDDEVGVPVAHFGLAIAGILQSGLVDQHAGAHAARVLEDAAGALVSQRLVGLLDDPLLLHALGQLFGVVLLQLELRAEDHQFVERAFAIGEHQLFASALDQISPRRVMTVALAGPLADVAAAAAGVAVQRAADRAGNADQGFQSGQSLAHRTWRWRAPAWRRRRR